MTAPTLPEGFRAFDADNHYYEAEDAFTRHMDPKQRRNAVQWAVVGDTNPVGCAFSDKIVYSEFFANNPDSQNPQRTTKYGIYEPHCGLDNVHLSWGHDEYLYHVVKDYLPEEALWMIRYHSCYVVHLENEYTHLLTERDHEMLQWVKAFNPYDLYSKVEETPNFEDYRSYYEELVAEFFPPKLKW